MALQRYPSQLRGFTRRQGTFSQPYRLTCTTVDLFWGV